MVLHVSWWYNYMSAPFEYHTIYFIACNNISRQFYRISFKWRYLDSKERLKLQQIKLNKCFHSFYLAINYNKCCRKIAYLSCCISVKWRFWSWYFRNHVFMTTFCKLLIYFIKELYWYSNFNQGCSHFVDHDFFITYSYIKTYLYY